MKNKYPLVSIIIPCRNERESIGKCLDSIVNQDYPNDKIEILVVDGMSEDETRKVVKEYINRYPFIKLLDNPRKITPVAMNTGIKQAKGDIIVMMGAHAIYKKNYISKCLKYLNKYKADNVGGLMISIPRNNTLIAKVIIHAISHPFGAGNSYFRIGSKKPKWVDTVFGGCYKKEVFQKIGLFNENLVRGQDIEFNLRLKKAGGKILLFPEVTAYYYPRTSNLRDFFLHNLKSGIWVIYSFKFTKTPLRLRHYIPFIFVSSLLGIGLLGIFFSFFLWLFIFILFLYLFINFYFSIKIMKKERNLRYIFVMPMAFMSRHIGYGLGSILGIIKLVKK